MAETAKQITVFLENKPGRLAKVLSELARQKVNITALSVMDKHEHGVLRLVVDDAARSRQVMQAMNTSFTEADTAESSSNAAPVDAATMRASVVFPEPGGP